MSNSKKYRVFKGHRSWAFGLFIFEPDITFKEIKSNPHTGYLEKEHYVGDFTFDDDFLNILQSKELNGKLYYFEYLYD
jgi:hypothetical protein